MAITKYKDQKWTGDTPIDGQQLSVNGYYTGHHMGKPMQSNGETELNNDPYYVAHKTVRFGTVMQDKASNANMPEVDATKAVSEGKKK